VLVAGGDVEVGSGDVLRGSGVVDGNVVVLSGGSVSPGASIGVFGSDVGDLMLSPGAVLLLEVEGPIPGLLFDQIDVQGSVILDGAVLNLAGSGFTPLPGTQLVLINNDGADAVSGAFVDRFGNPLAEGAIVGVGNFAGVLTYAGGVGGNDVVLVVPGDRPIIFVPPGGDSEGGQAEGDADQILLFLSPSSDRSEEPQTTSTPPVLAAETSEENFGSETTAAEAAELEAESAQSLRVFLRVYDDALMQEGRQYALPLESLNDLLNVFQRRRFPNGHYRVYVEDLATRRVSLVLEVHIYDGKVVPQNLRQETGDAEFPPAGKEPLPASEAAPTEAAEPNDDRGAGRDEIAPPVENAAPPAVLVAAGMATSAARRWSDRVREALETTPPPWSRLSRLGRR
jgi:hypothetical protein